MSTMLQGRAFDRQTEASEAEMRAATTAGDAAFVAAMNAAIRRRRVKVRPGTYRDGRPCTTRRMQGEYVMGSSCGSPAQMCAESVQVERAG